MNLAEISKLKPAQQRELMADQARATAARERVIAQAKPIPNTWVSSDGHWEGRPMPNGQIFWTPRLPALPAKSPPGAVSAAMQAILPQCPGEPWLPAKQLHAIPNPNFGAPSSAKSKSAVRHESLAATQRETLYAGRVHVRITSYRRRLLDPDNLTAKWFLDACRYARLIRDDKPEDITYQVGQEKVARKEDERTEIVIEPIFP